jgi:hypothetical protein
METSDNARYTKTSDTMERLLSNRVRDIIQNDLQRWVDSSSRIEPKVTSAKVRLLPISPRWPTVRCVPFSASHDAFFSVSFGENRRSDSVDQGRLRAESTSSRLYDERRLNPEPALFFRDRRILLPCPFNQVCR